jgi:benzodiazapine receptor
MQALRPFLPLIAFFIVIGVNAAANVVPINGYQTGELSDLYPTGFTPSGYVFSIWSLIYIGLAIYAFSFLYGMEAVKSRAQTVENLFLVNATCNAAWIFAWHYRLVELSLVLMLGILVTLILITSKIRKQGTPSPRQLLAVDGPFSLYFGWITTATLANLGAVFYAQQFYPFSLSMDQWALVTVVSAIAIYIWMGVTTRDIAYCCVFIWASYGIYVRQEGISDPVKLAAITGSVLLSVAVVWITMRKDFFSRK